MALKITPSTSESKRLARKIEQMLIDVRLKKAHVEVDKELYTIYYRGGTAYIEENSSKDIIPLENANVELLMKIVQTEI